MLFSTVPEDHVKKLDERQLSDPVPLISRFAGAGGVLTRPLGLQIDFTEMADV